jgi:hypothetical protein
MVAAARGFISRLGGPPEPLDGDDEDLAVARGGVGERASVGKHGAKGTATNHG